MAVSSSKSEKQDSFDVVKEFLRELEEGRVKKSDARKIAEHILEVSFRLDRLRARGAEYGFVQMSEAFEELVRLVRKQKGGLRLPAWSKAATFNFMI